MVTDEISNATLYYGLGSDIETALQYLASVDFSAVTPGRYDLDGGCFAMVQDYETVPRSEKRWEAHRNYIDVQFIAAGDELMGHTDIARLTVVEEYDEAKDITWLTGDGNYLTAHAGTFVILYPHDAHMPGVCVDNPASVRKVVVKVPAK